MRSALDDLTVSREVLSLQQRAALRYRGLFCIALVLLAASVLANVALVRSAVYSSPCRATEPAPAGALSTSISRAR